MENFLFLLIGGVALAINVFLNYNKEKKKNEDRTIQPPKKVVSQPRAVISSPPPRSKSVETRTMPSIPKEKFLSTIEGASSLRSETLLLSDKYQSEDEDDIYQNEGVLSMDNDSGEIGSDDFENRPKIASIRLETQEDFKKAIIYSTILERKY